MTINQILNIVDQMKPNAFPPEVKVMWINEVEGYVQTYIHLVSSADVITYDYSVDAETDLLVPPPHNGVYWTFLTAMIDYGNGEYNKYQNTITLYNNYMAEYQRWYATVYRPADGEMEVQGYYLSAYAIAVKHGFNGSEEDWIASLKGEKGDPGERGLDGEGLNVVGFYDTYDDLVAGVPDPTPGEAYGIGTAAPYVIYIWDRVSQTWKDNGTIKGEPGIPGSNGQPGSDGTTFTPSVDDDGNLSWSNNGGLPNPETVNIKGPAGSGGGGSETIVVTCEEGETMMDDGKTKTKYLVNVSMTTPEIIAALDEGKNVEIMDGDGFIYRLTVYTHNGGSMQAIFTACDMGDIIQCIFVAEYDDNGTEQFAMAYKASEKITTSSSQKTLIATAWEEDESGNSFQKVSVSSVGEESDCIIGLSSNATAEQREAARKAKLFATKLEAGYITVVADGTVPTVNIPIEIIYM